MPWAHRSTFPMLSFFLRPHHARGLSGWQSLVHAWPTSRGEDGEMKVGGNKEFEGEKLEKRRRRVVTGLHILQCNATAWSAATDPLLSHYVLHLTSRLSKLFWVFIHSHCHLYLLVQQLRSALEYKQVQYSDQWSTNKYNTTFAPFPWWRSCCRLPVWVRFRWNRLLTYLPTGGKQWLWLMKSASDQTKDGG